MDRLAQIEKLILEAEMAANKVEVSMWGFLNREKPRAVAYLAIRELLFPEEFTGIFGEHSRSSEKTQEEN